MAQTDINFKNPRQTLADGDQVRLTESGGAKFMISALTADVTVSIEMMPDSGNFRNLETGVATGTTVATAIKFPVGAILKFTGSAVEIWAYKDN